MSSSAASRFFNLIAALSLWSLTACTTPDASQTASDAPATATAAVEPEIDVAIPPKQPPVPLETLPTFRYDGDPQVLVTLEREIAAAGTDTARLSALAARLVGMMRDSNATFAARQAIAERLGQFPASALTAGENAAFFSAMLVDAQQFELARLALTPVAGASIDALFVRALPASTGAPLFALIQSAGHRRIAAAAPALVPLLGDPDARTAAAAAKALGQIGTSEALSALRAAPASPAVFSGIIAAAPHVRGRSAIDALQQIAASADAPAHLRAAAVRGLLDLDPTAAPARTVEVLAGSDTALKPAVIEAIAHHPAKSFARELAAKLPSFDPSTQSAVIAALAQRGDAAAVRAISAATRHADSEVRAAAITALGFLPGSPETARLLANIVSQAEASEAKLARLALARLRGDGVEKTVIDGARSAEPSLRIAFLEQIAARYMIESLPLLFDTRSAPDARVRAAALDALGEIAPPSAQPALLEWTIAASDPTEQARAVRALAQVTLRDSDTATRARAIVAAIESSAAPVTLRLLPVLQRVGGTASAEAAARLALSHDSSVANAAANTLSRWSDQTGLQPLIGVAEKAPSESARTATVQAALRFLERYRELPSSELTDSIARLLAVTRDERSRTRLVFLLGRAADDSALDLAGKLQDDPALATEAATALLAIKSNLAGKPGVKSSSGTWRIEAIVDRRLDTQWSTSVEPGRSLEFDFHLSRPIRQLTLDQSSRPDNYPEHLEVFVTDDPAAPGQALASSSGTPNRTVIDLPEGTRGRYVILRNTAERNNGTWTVTELYVD